jgi:hypothetical protein
MDAAFITIVQKLVSEQGKEALFNVTKCKGLLADYTAGEYKKESRLLIQALEAGVAKALDSTRELEICKKQQIRLLQDDYFLAEAMAIEVVESLIFLLHSAESQVEGSGFAKILAEKDAEIERLKKELAEMKAKLLELKKNTMKKPVENSQTAIGKNVSGTLEGEKIKNIILGDFLNKNHLDYIAKTKGQDAFNARLKEMIEEYNKKNKQKANRPTSSQTPQKKKLEDVFDEDTIENAIDMGRIYGRSAGNHALTERGAKLGLTTNDVNKMILGYCKRNASRDVLSVIKPADTDK